MLKKKSNSDVWCSILFADSYIDTLVNNGYKVAICEQMEYLKQTKKGMVRREGSKNCDSRNCDGARWCR